MDYTVEPLEDEHDSKDVPVADIKPGGTYCAQVGIAQTSLPEVREVYVVAVFVGCTSRLQGRFYLATTKKLSQTPCAIASSTETPLVPNW